MILKIDTTKRYHISLSLMNKGAEKNFEFETLNQSDDLLGALSSILKKEKIDLRGIQAILVHSGPGSYTGTRIGVTVANTISWSLNIPVYGYTDKNYQKVLLRVSKLNSKIFTKQALPIYPK